MTPPSSTAFIEALRRFSEGTLSPKECSRVVDQMLLSGPQIIVHDDSEPDVVTSATLEAALYLDFVLDDGPMQELDEARRLAAALVVLLSGVRADDVVLPDLIQLARWREETGQTIAAHAAGRIHRSGFERFIARRPWPNEIQHAVMALPKNALTLLGTAGEVWHTRFTDDHKRVLVRLPSRPGRVQGIARVIAGPEELARCNQANVLVAQATSPIWTPLRGIAAATSPKSTEQSLVPRLSRASSASPG